MGSVVTNHCKMAAGGVLPTHQRYVNGIPVPQNRKTLRLKEKYLLLLLVVSFAVCCFGAYFFLPDMREKINVREVGNNIFIPVKNFNFRHNPDEKGDHHVKNDKKALERKIEAAREQEKVL